MLPLLALAGVVLSGCGWTIQSTPDPTDRSLSGVSCTSPDACIAVGDSAQSGTDPLLAERWNGTDWQVLPSPPSPAAATASHLKAVSCSGPQACIAVGSYDHDSVTNPTVPLTQLWDGNSWSILETPIPPGPSGTMVSYLNDVSCTSINACTAVGYYTTSGGTLGLIERWNGSEWTIQANPSGVENNRLNGVSCTGEQECLAVGSAGDTGGAFSERWDGSSWEVLSTPSPSSTFGSPLQDVSCVTANACTAVGQSIGADLVPSALAEHWDGSAWAIHQTPDPLGRNLVGISCPATNTCTAVGESNPPEDSQRAPATLAQRWNGSEWSVHPTAQPAAYQFSFFSGVSCATAATCEAVGQATNLRTPGSAALAEGFTVYP
jgi:hypothetical protein